jgi:hypothetical protein
VIGAPESDAGRCPLSAFSLFSLPGCVAGVTRGLLFSFQSGLLFYSLAIFRLAGFVLGLAARQPAARLRKISLLAGIAVCSAKSSQCMARCKQYSCE